MEMFDMQRELRRDDPRDSELGKRLRDMRKKKKMSQLEVAREIGVSRTAYLKYESGRGGVPGKSLKLLANLFCTTTDYLLCMQPDHKERASEMPVQLPYLPAKSQAFTELQSLLNAMSEDAIEMMLDIAKVIAKHQD